MPPHITLHTDDSKDKNCVADAGFFDGSIYFKRIPDFFAIFLPWIYRIFFWFYLFVLHIPIIILFYLQIFYPLHKHYPISKWNPSVLKIRELYYTTQNKGKTLALGSWSCWY